MRKRSELKQWARQHLVGVENTLLPSFSPDLQTLDETGIRHDVQQSVAHGFFSMMVATETGVSLDEAKRMLEIAVDEADGRILVTTSLIRNSFEENMALLEHAGAVGVDGILLGYPPTFHPTDVEEVFEQTRRFCDATDLHVTLYPSPHFPFDGFHPSGFPLELLDRLADLDNVVAIKVGELGLFADVHRRVGDRLLVGCPVERYVPLLVQGFGMQWMGAGCYEVLQAPEKPYLVDYFRLLREGKLDEGMALYWKIAPMRNIFEQQFNQTVMSGTYNWHQQKFYQWCTGGNGGLTRQPAMKLHSWEAQQIRLGYYAIGIDVPEDDRSFWVGRSNAAQALDDVAASAPTTEEASPEGQPSEWRRLRQILTELGTEFSQVPMMIRPMVTRGFERDTGRSLAAWRAALDELAPETAHSVDATLERFAGELQRLAAYFDAAPEQSRRFVPDAAAFEALSEKMKHRAEAVRQLGRSLIADRNPR